MAGEVVLASYFNNNIGAVLSFLLARPIFRGRQTAAQTLTTSTFTAITLGTEDVDSAGGHSTVTNTSRYTGQYAGWYSGSGGAGFASNATLNRAADLRVNGTVLDGTQSNIASLSSSTTQLVISSELFFLNVSDYVELFAFQSSGGNLNTAVTGDQQPRLNVLWQSN
ncbi:MAG TPA: hypothetical protein VFY84_19220 [Jiangellales bacterium]|nr:hypothetical protein [Jiangellales bacterium]